VNGAAGAPLVLLCAGGTGGHLFPAEALAAALAARGVGTALATDARANRFGQMFAGRVHVLPSATLAERTPLAVLRTAGALAAGVVAGLRLMRRIRPQAVVGFGGYPTFPPVVAASLLRVATIIHEQNAVMGRANRMLAGRAHAVAFGFPAAAARSPALAARATVTGNPVRPAVAAAATTPFSLPAPGEKLRLLVFGGSQGARIMADIVPAAVALLSPQLRARLFVVQQARTEDHARVTAAYEQRGVEADVAPFFADLPQRMAAAQLVVSRSGASTVAELAAIGRPAILVPLPHAVDQDQLANAAVLRDAGGAILVEQPAFSPARLAADIETLAAAPERLVAMADAARTMGRLDAAERLASLVLKVAGIPAGGADRHEAAA
jgi:UDP-N-acetylglucosamine--N-acetylmuramyl-(pentapeptide) pyrophosphoryl-undecaprenol N-acetylglucosamine transferase